MKIPKPVSRLITQTYPMKPRWAWSVHALIYTLWAVTSFHESGRRNVRRVWSTTSRRKAWAMNRYLESQGCHIESIHWAEQQAEAWVDYMPDELKDDDVFQI